MLTKYGAIRTEIDGIVFASKKEATRYSELKLLQRAGMIQKLRLQPAFEIKHNGVKICKVILDFEYFDNTRSRFVFEDVKGKDLPISRIKRKLLMAFYGIDVLLT